MGACGGDCGIVRVREEERKAALAVAERIHPGLVWTRAACLAPAVPFDAIVDLARKLEALLPMRAVVRILDTQGAGVIDLLAGLHAPALLEIADGACLDPGVALSEHEVYLRVAFSPWGRFVTIQEVDVFAQCTTVDVEIVEEPISGVQDVRLRAMVKGLQGALRKARFTLLDMAFLATPLEGQQEAYVQEFREAPTVWSLLFDAAPPATVRASLVPRSRLAHYDLRGRRTISRAGSKPSPL
jgi:hypothetical protein